MVHKGKYVFTDGCVLACLDTNILMDASVRFTRHLPSSPNLTVLPHGAPSQPEKPHSLSALGVPAVPAAVRASLGAVDGVL